MDGGVRSGLDVLRALALGARAVMVGRAWAWALGGGGQAGVEAMLESVRAELSVGLALTGRTHVDQLDPRCSTPDHAKEGVLNATNRRSRPEKVVGAVGLEPTTR